MADIDAQQIRLKTVLEGMINVFMHAAEGWKSCRPPAESYLSGTVGPGRRHHGSSGRSRGPRCKGVSRCSIQMWSEWLNPEPLLKLNQGRQPNAQDVG